MDCTLFAIEILSKESYRRDRADDLLYGDILAADARNGSRQDGGNY